MKILIHIRADNDLLCHEALSLAFALASFDHEIRICLGRYLCQRIDDNHDKFINMLKSLPLYDIRAVCDDTHHLTADGAKKLDELDIAKDGVNLEDFDRVFYL